MAVVHGKVSGAPPETSDVAEVEKYLRENGADFKAGFLLGAEDAGANGPSIDGLELTAEKLVCGIAAVKLAGTMNYLGSTSLQLESFLIVKSGTTFMAMTMKPPGSSLETEMAFFKENISFK